jgi:hypothetical protein
MKNESTQPIAETITPLRTPKNGARTDRDRLKFQHRIKTTVVVFSFLLLIAGGGWLLYSLSNKSPLPETNSKIPAPADPPRSQDRIETATGPPPEIDRAQLEVQKASAEQKLADYLAAKNALDQMAAAEWGAETYLKMAELGRQADARFMDNQYRMASDLYDQATSLATDMTGRTEAALERLKMEGNRALDSGNGTLAQRNFSLALKIAPDDAAARQGLKRAETIGTVMELIESGRQHETNKAWSQASSDFSKALKLDPNSEKARQGLDRVNNLIEEKQFQQLMSDGLAAFHRKEYKLARSRLLEAKSLKSGSREVSDALLQVDQAIRLSKIENLRQAAQKAERSEDWQAALKSYLAVLDIDKNLQFAVRGKERALEQIEIDKRIRFFLAKPQILDSDSQLKNAVLLVEEANAINPRGPILSDRIKQLEQLVNVAQIPVKIAIESDNLTRVAVYKVGKLGRFSEHELELRPGTYTVVGTRDGYQDVRQKIVVKPGLQSLRITVKCKVKI